jgi:hypothetical protein
LKALGITIKLLCETIGVPERTFRAWRAEPSAPASETEFVHPTPPAGRPAPTNPRRRRPLKRPRFRFDLIPPGTQHAADTTKLKVLGQDLKLVADQDVGGREANLLAAVIVDDHECAEHVVDVITAVAEPGAQVLTDQGSPYVAEFTRLALEAAHIELAPQREADPIGKSTVERAFGSLQTIINPILELTNRLAAVVPALANVDLARAVTKLLVTAVLRAYQAGSRAQERAATQRDGVSAATLAEAAKQVREDALATERSVRQFLEHVHAIYEVEGSAETFVRNLKRFPIEALHEAERAFRGQVHRGDIQKRSAYFAKLVRNANDELRRSRARDAARDAEENAREQAIRAALDRRSELQKDPILGVAAGVLCLVCQWLPQHSRFLADGLGVGRAILHEALDALSLQVGPTVAIELAMSEIQRATCRLSNGAAAAEFLEQLARNRVSRVNIVSNSACEAPITSTNQEPHPQRLQFLRI